MAEELREVGSLLGKDSEFKGKLSFLGTVRIEGSFEGEIFSNDTLVVASGGEIRGTVEVGSLIITGGLVDAKVLARNIVELRPPGRLVGEVVTPSFQIERGAIFEGRCTMPDKPSDGDSEKEHREIPTEG